jgi:hypothetical protein
MTRASAAKRRLLDEPCDELNNQHKHRHSERHNGHNKQKPIEEAVNPRWLPRVTAIRLDRNSHTATLKGAPRRRQATFPAIDRRMGR